MATRRKFTPEYKAEAVALVVDSKRSVPEVAESLGIHENTLGNWVSKAKEQGDVPEEPLTLSERAELAALRKDNAQSFWATLKKEFIHLHPFDTVAKLRRETFEYIEGYYNTKRIHSTLGYLTPVEYEEGFTAQRPIAA